MSEDDVKKDDELDPMSETDDTTEPETDTAGVDETETGDPMSEIEDAIDAIRSGAASNDADDEAERVYTKDELEAAVAEADARMMRVMAEYENFRRRTAREKEKWTAEALERFVRDLLPVFDSFDKARETETDDAQVVLDGLNVTYRQLTAAFEKHGIEVIDPTGEEFDPRFHEALARIPAEDADPGTFVQVFERGYRIGPLLVRPARGAVAAGE